MTTHAAALLSACSQANTHPTFPLLPKCQDTETGLSVAGWASQLAKVKACNANSKPPGASWFAKRVQTRAFTGFKKCP